MMMNLTNNKDPSQPNSELQQRHSERTSTLDDHPLNNRSDSVVCEKAFASDRSNDASISMTSISTASSSVFGAEGEVTLDVPPLVMEPHRFDTEASYGGASPTDDSAVLTATLSPAQHRLVITQMARQLEYYFSQQNLDKDTYLRTLRELNDGCVPASILANFAKIRLICAPYYPFYADEASRIHAIVQAVTEATDLLRVSWVDATTGKIVTNPGATATLVAVQPIDNEPRTVETKGSFSASAADAGGLREEPPVNTIILHDVEPQVTELDVRTIFESIEDCPEILDVHADVAYCWFVTLDTTCRQDMLRVMMQLRTKLLGDSYVQARLKTTSPITDPAAPAHALVPTLHHSYNFLWTVADSSCGSGVFSGDAKKAKKRRNKKKKQLKKKSEAAEQSSSRPKEDALPPSLGEEHFPTLQQDKKVEWDTPPCSEVVERVPTKDGQGESGPVLSKSSSSSSSSTSSSLKSSSDAEDTATITTSSSSIGDCCSSSKKSVSMLPTLSGYAAALRKSVNPKAEPVLATTTAAAAAAAKEETTGNNDTRHDNDKEKSISSQQQPMATTGLLQNEKETVTKASTAPLSISPPLWGQGKTFADILRVDKH